jgi:chaperonin cofactor prefoldin
MFAAAEGDCRAVSETPTWFITCISKIFLQPYSVAQINVRAMAVMMMLLLSMVTAFARPFASKQPKVVFQNNSTEFAKRLEVEAVNMKIDIKMETVNVKIDYLGKKIDDVDQKIGKLETKIDNVEKKLETKIDNVEKKLEAKIDNLDSKFDILENKLDRITTIMFVTAAVFFVFEKGPVFFDLVEKFPSFWALFKSASLPSTS